MINITKQSSISFKLREIWKLSLFFCLVFNTAFASAVQLLFLNRIFGFVFLAISVLVFITNGTIKINGLIFTNCLFMFWVLVGALYSTSPSSLEKAYMYFVSFGVVFCVINFINTEDDVVYIFKALMVGGFVLDLYLLLYYGSSLFEKMLYNDRVGDIAGNLNSVGIKSCYSSCMALFFALNGKTTKLQKSFLFLLFLFCSFFALITASRKVVVLLFVGLFFSFFFRTNYKKNFFTFLKKFLSVIVVLSIAIFVIYNVKYFHFLSKRFDNLLTMLFSGEGVTGGDRNRLYYIKAGFDVFLRSPLTGEGTAASYNYFQTYSHCNYIEILMNHGLIGFIIFYWYYPKTIFKSIFQLKNVNNQKKHISAMCLFFISSIMILSFGLVYYFTIYYQILVSTSIIYIVNISKNNDLPKIYKK